MRKATRVSVCYSKSAIHRSAAVVILGFLLRVLRVSISTEGCRVVHGAGLSGGVTWRAATSGDCHGRLGMGSCLRRSPPSCEALIRWNVVASNYTEVPHVLPDAGLNGGVICRS